MLTTIAWQRGDFANAFALPFIFWNPTSTDSATIESKGV
jgi:hypothetical protein